MSEKKIKSESQQRVSEIIAKNARGILFIDLPEVDLRHVATSSLYLLYKVVNTNTHGLLESQRLIAEELSRRAKTAERVVT